MSTERIIIRDEIDDRILSATEHLIAELGYGHVRLIDIADHAGVSVGSLQHRFRNRKKLLEAAVVRADERSVAQLMQATSGIEHSWDRLIAQLDYIIFGELGATETSYWLELVSAASRNEELLGIMSAQQEHWLQALRENISAGLASGQLESGMEANELAVAILALIDGLVASRVLGSDYQNPKWVGKLLHEVVATLVRPSSVDAD